MSVVAPGGDLGGALARDGVLATVTWELLTEDLSVVSVWRGACNLCRVDGRCRVFASTDHAA